MSYEEQIMQALARGYCAPENGNKELDATLIEAMTVEVLKSVGFIPTDSEQDPCSCVGSPGDDAVVKGGSQDGVAKLKKELYTFIYKNHCHREHIKTADAEIIQCSFIMDFIEQWGGES